MLGLVVVGLYLRPMRTVSVLIVAVVGVVACTEKPSTTPSSRYSEYRCPAPIGPIVREDCTTQALRYEGTSFSASVGVGGVGAQGSYTERATREADALVQLLKEQRVSLCNDFNTCKMTVAEYRAEAQRADDSFVALIALKEKMAQIDAQGATAILAEIQRIRARRSSVTSEPAPSTVKAAAPTALANGIYTIIGKGSGLCLDVPGGDGTDGLGLQQWGCHSGDNQRWQLRLQSDGTYLISSKQTGKCLDIPRGAVEAAWLEQYTCHGNSNQRWKLEAQSDGSFAIKAAHSGKCLDVANGSLAAGGRVLQFECHLGDNQRWRLTAL